MSYYSNIVYTMKGSSSTVPVPTGIGNLTVSVIGGGTGGSGGTTWASSNGATWNASTSPYVTVGATNNSALQVSGDADIKGTLRVKGVDIGELLDRIQDRLAILVPDPARLEKYEALKQAYDHYKTLEALCVEENNPKQT